MEKSDIVNRFLDAELCLHPNALNEISNKENPSEFVNHLLSSVEKRGSVITTADLKSVEIVIKKGKKRMAEEYEVQIELKDVYKESPSKASLDGFVDYFNNRYDKGVRVFKERKHLFDSIKVEQALNVGGNKEIKIIGLVDALRTSKKGNVIIMLEDPSGVIPVVVLKSDRELHELTRSIVHDDIICVEGVTGSREGGIIIAKEISFPDIPLIKSFDRNTDPLAIAMISDIHIGSYEFMDKEFSKFIKWLNCKLGSPKQRELAERVKYLVIAGDLVDGVGIYPGQINDLSIPDIFGQYSRLAEMLGELPDYLEVIVSPGNHDATRQAEPQSPIFEDFAADLYCHPSVHMVGNPCYAKLHGTNVLVYHGRSMDDIIAKIPGLSYSKPEKAMLNLIKKRQLVPIFGEKVPVSPGNSDCLFIEDVPDILHCGHVHTTGVFNYRGVTLVNSGTFQSQTEFQKRLNMKPDPGKVPVFDIASRNTTIMKFA